MSWTTYPLGMALTVTKYVITAVNRMAKITMIAVKTAHVFDTNTPDGRPLNTYFWPFFVFSCPPRRYQRKEKNEETLGFSHFISFLSIEIS